MKKILIVFSHGKESGPLGSKIRRLMEVAMRHGAEAISVDYREHPAGVAHDHNQPGEADRRVAQLLTTQLPAHDRLVLVGSSMGGYVSTVASQEMRPAGVFLLAPAFYLPGYAQQQPAPYAKQICIVHGWGDDVVPTANSIRFAEKHRADLYLLEGDHRLNDVLHKIIPIFEQFLQQVIATSEQ